jgi:hypothetical protein
MLGAGAAPLRSQEATLSPHGPLKSECKDCHGPEGWTPVRISRRFDHSTFDFPLQGSHATAACMSCHKTLTFTATPTRCAECHLDVHRGEFGPGCEQCHTLRGFTDRSQVTRLHETLRFRLDGAHRGVECEECHRPAGQGGLQFVGTRTTCVGCHEPQFRAAAVGGHGSSAPLVACENCHRAGQWVVPNFAHNPALTGAHRAIACVQCHGGLNYAGTPADCVGCHRKDYDSPATAPNHAQVGFSIDCASCHTTLAWTAPYDHSRTGFPLTGAHKPLDCLACHADKVYAGKPTACVSCHLANYTQATNPVHTGAAFPQTCEVCHSSIAWTPATFDHSRTAFPLTGRHKNATCAQCHGDGVYAGKPTACISCHLSDFQQAEHHRGQGRTDCQSCHSTSRWGD